MTDDDDLCENDIMDYEAIQKAFTETRDVGLLRTAHEPDLRESFERFTCHQGGTDEFMDEFFERLKTVPYTGEEPSAGNWDREIAQ